MSAKMIFFLLLIILTMGNTQDATTEPVYGWEREMVGNLNFTQNNFDNWTQGGEDSWSWQLDVNSKFTHKQEKYEWTNTGKLSFGRTKVGDVESRKAADEIKIESVIVYKLNPLLNPYFSVSGQTQLAKGYQYTDAGRIEVSDFMDPAYFVQSIGIQYAPSDNFQTRLGAALKETITSDHPIPYADDPETPEIEKTRVEAGAESVTDFGRKLSRLIVFTTKLELFSNMEGIKEVDVNWDNLFSAKVSQYIAVNFNIKLFYDRDISTKRQLKQTLSVGLTYTFL